MLVMVMFLIRRGLGGLEAVEMAAQTGVSCTGSGDDGAAAGRRGLASNGTNGVVDGRSARLR